MASVTTVGLSQVVANATHCTGYILDLMFCSGLQECDQREEELTVVPLIWTDHYLLGFRLRGIPKLHRGGNLFRRSTVRARYIQTAF